MWHSCDLSSNQYSIDNVNQVIAPIYCDMNSGVKDDQNDNDTLAIKLELLYDTMRTLKFVILNNNNPLGNSSTNKKKYESDGLYRQKLQHIAEKYKDRSNLHYLVSELLKLSNINFKFIIYSDGIFQIFNDYKLINEHVHRSQAFIVLDQNDTICGPLFTYDYARTIQTVFDVDNVVINDRVDKYVESLNNMVRNCFQLTSNKNSSKHPSPEDLHEEPMTDYKERFFTDLASDISQVASDNDRFQHEITEIEPRYHTLNTISLSIQDPETKNLLDDKNTYDMLTTLDSEVIAEAMNTTTEFGPIWEDFYTLNDINAQINELTSTPIKYSFSAEISPITAPVGLLPMEQPFLKTVSVPTLIKNLYEAPRILIRPKSDWNPRYPSDLIPKQKPASKTTSNKRLHNSEKSRKRHATPTETQVIGLLQGVGGQRNLIQVKVPSGNNETLYLGVSVRTIKNHPHPLKVVVQEKALVNKVLLNHNNNLSYLQFDRCDPKHSFDPNSRSVYMEITSEQRVQQRKSVPVYMFNLYQNKLLTKSIIKSEKLEQCMLAFWFCVKENDVYIPVSAESTTCIIAEKKKKKCSPKNKLYD